MNQSTTFPVGCKATTATLGSRTFKFCIQVYSNRLFIGISDVGGNLGSWFTVRQDNPIPDSPFATAEPTFTVKTLFGAESDEGVLIARLLGGEFAKISSKPILLALALTDTSTPTIQFVCSQVKELMDSFSS